MWFHSPREFSIPFHLSHLSMAACHRIDTLNKKDKCGDNFRRAHSYKISPSVKATTYGQQEPEKDSVDVRPREESNLTNVVTEMLHESSVRNP
jgi:hypothetical protein